MPLEQGKKQKKLKEEQQGRILQDGQTHMKNRGVQNCSGQEE